MADQHDDPEHRPPDAPRPGAEENPGAELEPRRPSEPAPPAAEQTPAPLDPEELRKFQEFQRFQQFQRFTEQQQAAGAGSGDLVPAGQPAPEKKRKAPAWLVSLGGKIIGALLTLAALILGAAWAIDYFLGADDPLTPGQVADQGGKKAEGTKLYASSPYEAVRRIYDDVAQGGSALDDLCLRMDETARGQFAVNFGHEDCAATAVDLHADVTDVNDYAESLPSNISNPSLGDEIEIDSCEVALTGSVNGGPALGTFTVTRIPEARGDQWLITGHRSGPAECPKRSE